MASNPFSCPSLPFEPTAVKLSVIKVKVSVLEEIGFRRKVSLHPDLAVWHLSFRGDYFPSRMLLVSYCFLMTKPNTFQTSTVHKIPGIGNPQRETVKHDQSLPRLVTSAVLVSLVSLLIVAFLEVCNVFLSWLILPYKCRVPVYLCERRGRSEG